MMRPKEEWCLLSRECKQEVASELRTEGRHLSRQVMAGERAH